ncbi:MAG: hypothetical protein JXA33_22580 [Anaerolineae bacterium]|nr:hypothetical protein [Anaerolineae bacterium]
MNTVAEVKRCARCILPASLPSAQLDEAGVCHHCRTFEASHGNWDAVKAQRKSELEELVEQARQLHRPYDCLIPLSGGKDSTYALYVCSKVYGLKCLSVTFDNGYLAEPARANIKNAMEATGADHLMFTPNRANLLNLYKQFLETSGDFCSVCMRGIHVSTVTATKAFDIPLVVTGNGNRFAYLNMMEEVFQYGDASFFRNVLAESATPEDLSLLGAIPSQSETDVSQVQQGMPKRIALKLLRLARKVPDRLIRMLDPPESHRETS